MLSRSMGRSCHFALALSFSASAAQCCISRENRHTGGESADWSGGGYVDYDAKGMTLFMKVGNLRIVSIACGLSHS